MFISTRQTISQERVCRVPIATRLFTKFDYSDRDVSNLLDDDDNI